MNLNPIMIVVVALAALAAAFIVAYQRSEEFREFVDKTWAFLKDVFVPIFDVLSSTAKAALEVIIDLAKQMWENIQNVVGLIKAIFEGDFGEAWNRLKDLIGGVFQGIFTLFIELPGRIIAEVVPALAKALFKLIDGPMADLRIAFFDQLDKIFGFFKALPSRIGGLVKDFTNAGLDMGKSFMDGLASGVKNAVGFVGDFAKGLANAVINFFNDKVIDWINQKIPDKIEVDFFPDINLPDNPLPRIPTFAKGGIVTGPQLAMLGDNPSGTEMVVPLEKAGAMGFGGNTINLTVNAGLGTNGQQVGAEIITALKTWQRSNGVIPVTTS